MTPDGDELDSLLCVVQNAMVSVRNAMAAETAMPNERERKRARRDRLEAQMRMLEAARRACQLAIDTPRPPLPEPSILAIEKRHGFVPGTFATAVGRPSRNRAVLVAQDLDLAIQVTRAEQAIEDGPVDRAFMAAVFRICCATVVGALVGAPLGALAADENIVLKMAEAAVVVGLGATTLEVVQPLSVRFARGPVARPDGDYQLATGAVRDFVPPSELWHESGRGRLESLDDGPVPDVPVPVEAVAVPLDEAVALPLDEVVEAAVDEPVKPDDDVVVEPVVPDEVVAPVVEERPVESPVSRPFDDPFRGPF